MRATIIILLLAVQAVHAQERLTLQDAIVRTLKYNFDINIAELSAEQAKRNNTLGNAGFAPNINLNATTNNSLLNVQSQLVNGNEQNNPRAAARSYNPSLNASWTIFDGGRMFVVKKQLDRLEALGEVQLHTQVQTMVSRAMQMYSEVVWRKRQVIAIDTALHLARVRMAIANLKYETGLGAKIDYLQAQVDYNARLADSILYLGTMGQAMDSLAVLMGDQQNKSYIVDDSVPLSTQLTPIDRERLEAENLVLNAYRLNAEVSHLNAKIAKTYFMPTVTLNSALVYNFSASAVGFALSNRSYGGNYGFGFTMPVFQGGNIRRQVKVASLQAIKDDLLYERQYTSISRRYRIAWRNYQLAVASYNLERGNILVAQENVNVQHVRFRVGIGTTLEARQAENDYVAALVRLYTAEYNLKVAEVQVLELENQLVTPNP